MLSLLESYSRQLKSDVNGKFFLKQMTLQEEERRKEQLEQERKVREETAKQAALDAAFAASLSQGATNDGEGGGRKKDKFRGRKSKGSGSRDSLAGLDHIGKEEEKDGVKVESMVIVEEKPVSQHMRRSQNFELYTFGPAYATKAMRGT